MNTPNEIMWVLGNNRLGFILSQERKHWLLKTDKKKQVQDNVTGDVFQGQVDNRGSDIVVESAKLPFKSNILDELKFDTDALNEIMAPAYSAFTYSSMLNGLMFSRITSMTYPYTAGETTAYKNYRIEFTNCTEVKCVFGGSNENNDVYASKWLKTTTAPKIAMMDDEGEYSIKVAVEFNEDVDGLVYYYPLTTSLQMLPIHRITSGSYATDPVNSDSYIGYPAFWYTCDNTNIGPTLTITNNSSALGKQLMYIGNEGASSRYTAKLYVGIDGDMDATPNDTATSGWILRAFSTAAKPFNDSDADFDKPLNVALMDMYNTSTGTSYKFNITTTDVDSITMSRDCEWEYKDTSYYSIDMSEFDVNCLSVSTRELISAFTVHFKETIPFYTSETKDIGYAGARFSSSIASDQTRYPYSLNKWSGLPTWLQESEEYGTPQHAVLYAIHNTPSYVETLPESRQVAALILDPGMPKAEETDNELDPLTNDERGRVYVLSNDDAIYENNATAAYPKPARTAARICDIPTSVTDFMNVEGLLPVSVVDKEYVRSEASFTENDKKRLYNELGSHIVRPTDLDANGNRICDIETDQDNEYIFCGKLMLDKVSLVNPENDLREYVNLNPKVDPTKVKVANITDPGSGYKVNDTGIIIIGGCSMEYQVTSASPIVTSPTGVTSGGEVLEVSVFPHDIEIFISLSNFDMEDSSVGYTKSFGSSHSSNSTGEGLKVSFLIEDYDDIRTKKGNIKENLIAFVRESDGLHMYKYSYGNGEYGSEGYWGKYQTISEFEVSETDKSIGNVSTKDSYLYTTLPCFRPISVFDEADNTTTTSTLETVSTGSFINIIDRKHTPFMEVENGTDTDLTRVDLCRLRCDGLKTLTARLKDTARVIEAIRNSGYGRYDSYIIWRWIDKSDSTNRQFEFGIVYRSLNNLLSTDKTTYLPKNNLKYDSFVNTNVNTTVVWDVPDVGPMMWIYSPDYDRHEKYQIDPSTREVRMVYTNNDTDKKMDWGEVVIGTTGETVADATSGTLKFNILSNCVGDNPGFTPSDSAIYDQPEYKSIATEGTPKSSVTPKGNWRLVFPRVDMFHITDQADGTVHSNIKLRLLQTIKAENITEVKNVVDDKGNNINAKCLVLAENPSGITMKMYNRATGNWDTI